MGIEWEKWTKKHFYEGEEDSYTFSVYSFSVSSFFCVCVFFFLFSCVSCFLFVPSDVAVENAIVSEISSIRSSLFETTEERVSSDEELRKAFLYTTQKLQKGLMLLRRWEMEEEREKKNKRQIKPKSNCSENKIRRRNQKNDLQLSLSALLQYLAHVLPFAGLQICNRSNCISLVFHSYMWNRELTNHFSNNFSFLLEFTIALYHMHIYALQASTSSSSCSCSSSECTWML